MMFIRDDIAQSKHYDLENVKREEQKLVSMK